MTYPGDRWMSTWETYYEEGDVYAAQACQANEAIEMAEAARHAYEAAAYAEAEARKHEEELYLMGNASKLPVIYLAGAIRDAELDYDAGWREQVITALRGKAVFLNPLGGKTMNEKTKEWRMSGIPSTVTPIVRHDAWCVDNCDIILADLSALAVKYPNLGTLLEIGRGWGRGKLIYVILDPNYKGHDNGGMFRLHPFLEDIGAVKFETVANAIAFLARHLDALSGANPHFDGVVA